MFCTNPLTMLNRILSTCLLYLLTLTLAAQSFSGRVVDNKSGKPISFVSVVLSAENAHPIAYTQTDDNGGFRLETPGGKQGALLTFSVLGYAKQSIPVKSFTNGSTIRMAEAATQIREVKVTSKRIRMVGDTVSFSVAGFKQKQDRSIADVIAKMPGLNVTENGTITYQGKAINKFYIEGMDLLGGRYSMAGKNLQATKVKTVQVLRNHQAVKMLRNKTFSDQAALNIVLEDNAKNAWFGMADVGIGMQLQKGAGSDVLSDQRVLGMLFGKKMQSLNMYKHNNTGKNIQTELNDLVQGRSWEQQKDSWLQQPRVSSPSLNVERYNQNNTHIVASNQLFRIAKDATLRFQADLLNDQTIGQRTTMTTYNDVDGTPTISEVTRAQHHRHELRLELNYNLNSDKIYIDNKTKLYADWNKSTAYTLLNQSLTPQWVLPQQRAISNQFSMINKMGKEQSFSFNAFVGHHDLPGRLLLYNGHQEQLDQHTTLANVNAAFRHPLAGIMVSYTAGLTFDRQEAEMRQPETYVTDRLTHVMAHLTPGIRQTFARWDYSLTLPLTYHLQSMRTEKSHKVAVEPLLRLRYKPNSQWEIIGRYNYNYKPADLKDITRLPYFSSYISRSELAGHLDYTDNHSLNIRAEYTHVPSGFFANASAGLYHTHHFPLYTGSMQGIVYTIKHSGKYTDMRTWMMSGELNKSFGMAKFVAGLLGNINTTRYDLMLHNARTPFRLVTARVGTRFSLRPHRLLSIEQTSNYLHNKRLNLSNKNASAPALHAFNHRLKLFFLPGNWEVACTGELYHSNDRSVSTSFFADTQVSYRGKNMDISVAVNNWLGCKTYYINSFSERTTTYIMNELRPREVVTKVSFSF